MENTKADTDFKAEIIRQIQLWQTNDVSLQKTAEVILEKAKEWKTLTDKTDNNGSQS